MKSEAFRQNVVVDFVPECIINQMFFGLHSLKVCLLFSIQSGCVELQCHSSFLVSIVLFSLYLVSSVRCEIQNIYMFSHLFFFSYLVLLDLHFSF